MEDDELDTVSGGITSDVNSGGKMRWFELQPNESAVAAVYNYLMNRRFEVEDSDRILKNACTILDSPDRIGSVRRIGITIMISNGTTPSRIISVLY